MTRSLKSPRTAACEGFSVYTGHSQSQTTSCEEEQEQNQLHSNSGEKDMELLGWLSFLHMPLAALPPRIALRWPPQKKKF